MIPISPRYEESHEHKAGVCVYQYVREINGKPFLFTNVNIPGGSVYMVTEKVGPYFVNVDRHSIKVFRNA